MTTQRDLLGLPSRKAAAAFDVLKGAGEVLNVAGQRSWFEISAPTNAAETGAPSRALIRLYDAIGGWFGVGAKDFVQALDELDVDEIELHINSPGGVVWDGIAIRNALIQHPAKVTAIVDGIAASAASFIALAGDEVVMSPNSEMMIHDATGICVGWASDMRETGDFLDRVSTNVATMYARKAGGDVAAWRELMLAETWYSAEEAVAAGLADRIDGEADPAAAEEAKNAFDLSKVYAHAGRASAPAPKQPTASAAGSTSPSAKAPRDTSQEGGAAVNDAQLATLRQKLGVSEDADFDAVSNALDEALAERADPAAPPSGTVLMDEAALAALQADAAAGRQARNEQVASDRLALVNNAIADGRIPPARKEHWLANLAADDEGARTVLAGLPKGLIPVAELGHGDGVDDASATDTYSELYPDEQKGA